MKILHLISQYPSKTGSGVYLTQVYKNFKILGYEQKVFCCMNSDDLVETNFDDIEILKFKEGSIDFPVVGMSDIMPYESFLFRNLTGDKLNIYINELKDKISQIYESYKPDVIFSNHLYIMTSIVSQLDLPCKVFGFCHGTCLRQLYKNDLHKDFVVKGIKKLDGIFALSHLQKDEILDIFGFDSNKVYVIGGGYDSEFYYKKDYIKHKFNDKLRIIYAGKFSRAKGVIYLLKAFNVLKDNYNVDLVLAGSGVGEEAEEILNFANTLGERVELHGYMKMSEIGDLFRSCDIFAMSSLYEGLSLVTIEAMACGLNVVTNRLENLLNFVGEKVYNSSYMEIVDLPDLVDTDKLKEEDEEGHINNWVEYLEKQIINTYNNNYISDDVYERISEISWKSIIKSIINNINRN